MLDMAFTRAATLAAMAAGSCLPTVAQTEIQVVIDRGLTDDPPYTIIYPDVLRQVDDSNPQTVLTVQHPGALLQCDFYALPSAPADWQADAALEALDLPKIEAEWSTDFPGFKIDERRLTTFASGTGLFYEGEADDSPMAVPVEIIHARIAEGKWMYAIECVMEKAIATDVRPMLEFIIGNFSTRSDGRCCVDTTDDRG